ncbi:hypothetical protein GOV08_02710, partial [Candidatus Woesearchaeota archaeon]|nr:hypothetical protein [Candidatus Woesearchaeota archaeon]
MEQESKLIIGEYPYTYARISAMKAKLLKKSDYDKLLKMKESEIAKYLQDNEYKEQINKLGVTLTGSELVERAIRDNLTATLQKLKKISAEGLRVLISEYLKKEDVWNIKTIIRGKFTKTPNEDIRKLLVPVGDFDEEALNKLLAEEDIEKILSKAKLLKNEEIKETYKTFKDKKELEILESVIDKSFYKNLIKFINMLPEETKIIKNFLAGEIDAVNIKVILKFKREKVSEDIIKNLVFVSKASRLTRSKWENIINAKSLDGIAKEFEKTPYEKIVKDAIENLEKTGSFSELDLDLQKHLLKNASVRTHQNP